MNHCIGAILSPLNHQYCRSTTYHFLVSNLFLERLVFLVELALQLVALVLELALQLVALVLELALQLVALVLELELELELELVLVHQLHPTIDPIQLEVHLALLEAFLICPYQLKSNSLLHPLHFVTQQIFSLLLRFYHQGLRFCFEEQR
ncbi:Uncharacterised protein [Streptococcus pneumoniae]|nr:Uncharacterised protein [Streptococcus pneumoniae]